MLETLSKGFRSARLKLQGKAELDEGSVAEALQEVRISLIEADVALDVVDDFLRRVRESTFGQVVKLKDKRSAVRLTAADHFVKACNDELEALMGPVDTGLQLDGRPAVMMMVGLQGSGKTTTAGKLARMLAKQGKKPMLVAADIYRPAAIDQLVTLGRKLNVPVFTIRGMDPVKLAGLAISQAKNVQRDVVIIDTAGRLAIDDVLMRELEQIKEVAKPSEILFVCDAMIGQDAVRTAAEFDRRLAFTGFVLTKLDGDARGGAALAIKAVTGKPIKFLGMGEGLDKLEEFRPAGLASRILGFGDVVGLVKDFEQVMDKDRAEADAMTMLKGGFTYDHFQEQLRAIKSMGSLRDVMAKLPFMDELMSQVPAEALDDYEMVRAESMIQSMTRQERRRPDLLDDSRMRRIARGSGRELKEVQDLHQRFRMTRDMMGQVGSATGLMGNAKMAMDMRRQLQQMAQGMPGMGGMLGGSLPAPMPMRAMSKEERDARRKKAKDARKARKKQRR